MRSSFVETSSSPSSFLFSLFLPAVLCAVSERGSTRLEAAAAEPKRNVRRGVSMIHLCSNVGAYFPWDEHARTIMLLGDGYRKPAAGNQGRRKTSPGPRARWQRHG